MALDTHVITIADDEWTNSSYGHGSRLLASISINGYAMHLEAFEIVERADGRFLVDDDADRAYSLLDSDSTPTIIEIRGRSYALLAHPFAE